MASHLSKYEKTMQSRILQDRIGLFARAATLAFMVGICPQGAFAATNNAVDPGGGSVTLNPSGEVTVNAITLSLVKQACDTSGVLLPDSVLSGQVIYFVLYIDNTTSAQATNVGISDLINKSQFVYVPGSLETTVVPSGSNDAAIWGGVWTPLTDQVGGPDDMASVTEPSDGTQNVTIGAVSVQINQTLNIDGKTLRAIRFKATVR